MSKLSFRARALDPSKQMPIYLAEELPDLPEYSAINRAVPQMPSGMEKEEESEHHLQRAICTGLIIPTPEVFTTDQDFYDKSYPPNYKMPRQMIHMQPLGLEQDVPDYDMDSADELWMNQQSRRLDLTPLKFEQMMDRLEKSSGQTVVTLNEAKALLKHDDEVSIAVYDYWLNKRLKMQHPLILTVKTENRPGASSNNPYLAFRRRTEKMQTRKNRKNDETSYEKMLKLRRDLQRATTMLEMVKRREKTKREQLHLSIEIFEKRVQLRDFNGVIMSELSATIKNSRPAFAPLYPNQYSHHSSSSGSTPTGGVPGSTSACGGVVLASGLLSASVNNTGTTGGHLYASASQYLNSTSMAMEAINASSNSNRKEKRQYKKRKHKLPRDKQQQQQQQYLAGVGMGPVAASAGVGAAGLAAAASASLSAHHHHSHLHHLHRQSSSPAANESAMETEEDDFMNSNGQHSHAHGYESEEEAMFAFKRKQSCDYVKPLERNGNWPWEPQDENGISDPKYRFTLTSLRYPRPRCIGFARRRLGRGGRVILDRVGTNLDDFWSQLDYTIFKSEPRYEPVKSASPPTVVDLPNAMVATPSLISTFNSCIKVEPSEGCLEGLKKNIDSDIEEEQAAISDEEFVTRRNANGNILRDDNYISALTLLKKRGRQHQLRERHNLQMKNEGATTKREKLNCADGAEEVKTTRTLLERLAQTLEYNGFSCKSVGTTSEQPKREKLNGDDVSQVVVSELAQKHVQQPEQQRSNHRVNKVLNNNNSCSNINKNVSDSNKINVIKLKMAALLPAIKQEETTLQHDVPSSSASADDSNEPLSSIQKAAVSASVSSEILDDEENLNLAKLSTLIRHTTVKKEKPLEVNTSATAMKAFPGFSAVSDDDDFASITLNRMADVIRLRDLHRQQQRCDDCPDANDTAVDPTESLSPTSNQRLNVCKDLLSEIRQDWIHFRPKTPTVGDLGDASSSDYKLAPLVDWSPHTPLNIELLRLPSSLPMPAPSRGDFWHGDDSLFACSTFKYAELSADSQLLQTHSECGATSPTRSSSQNAECVDFNSSGDSLNDVQILGDGGFSGDGDAETDESMLDNILQECQIEDAKTLHQATNFWNGLLDGSEAVDEGGASLLDCNDAQPNITDIKRRVGPRGSGGKFRPSSGITGSSNFSVMSLKRVRDEAFFQPVAAVKPVETAVPAEIKTEPEDLPAEQTDAHITATAALNCHSTDTTLPNHTETVGSVVPTAKMVQPFVTTAPKALVIASQPQTQSLAAQLQQQHVIPATTAVVGDIITLSNAVTTSLPQQQQHTQLRNVSFQQIPLRQQQLLLMQRDMAQGPVISHYVPSLSGTQATVQRQPTLAPLGGGTAATGHHMIYTTTSSNSVDGCSGPQKIYIQKAPISVATTLPSQVPSSINTNALITLSSVKLDPDGQGQNQPAALQSGKANILTIDGNTVVTTSTLTSSGTPNLSILSTASGQSLALHSISAGNGAGSGNSSTPLIVTTAIPRNTQQTTSQILQQHGGPQQIVWRQISTPNAAGGSSGATAVLTTTTETAAGNKIVWAGRPQQKRHVNGPEATEINKLLHRKFSQRKIISQQQHQIQITKQQLQQLQAQQPQHKDDDGQSAVLDGALLATTNATVSQGHHQQLSKVQMPSGKVIKMASLPIFVSELNVQQPQQQQQRHNSAATIATNHNYSLNPTTTLQQQPVVAGNKVLLTSSSNNSISSGGASTNFSMGTSGELQLQATAGQVGTAVVAGQAAHKIHYTDLQNSSLKVNFVSTGGGGGSCGGGATMQSANILLDGKSVIAMQQQHQQASAVMINQTAALSSLQQQQLLQQQQKLKRERILNIIGGSMDCGKMQMQPGPGGMTTAVVRGRIGNNQTIFTNMRTMPISATVSGAQLQPVVQGVASIGGSTLVAVGDGSLSARPAVATIANDNAPNKSGDGSATKHQQLSGQTVVSTNNNSSNNSGGSTANNMPATAAINANVPKTINR